MKMHYLFVNWLNKVLIQDEFQYFNNVITTFTISDKHFVKTNIHNINVKHFNENWPLISTVPVYNEIKYTMLILCIVIEINLQCTFTIQTQISSKIHDKSRQKKKTLG